MGFKELFLQKGWAGKTISRQETIERITPLIHQLVALNHYYTYAADHLSDESTAERFRELLKTSRTDLGKLNETVLSCGGASYHGTDLEPEDFTLDGDAPEMLNRLQELEQDFQDALAAQLDSGDHQMRTRAILSVVQTNSRTRLEHLSHALRGQPRRAS